MKKKMADEKGDVSVDQGRRQKLFWVGRCNTGRATFTPATRLIKSEVE